VRAEKSLIAVGTDSPEAAHHFLCIIDGEILCKTARDDPVLCYVRVSEHVSDLRWLDSETLLASTGKGNMMLFRFDKGASTLSHIGKRPASAESMIATQLRMA